MWTCLVVIVSGNWLIYVLHIVCAVVLIVCSVLKFQALFSKLSLSNRKKKKLRDWVLIAHRQLVFDGSRESVKDCHLQGCPSSIHDCKNIKSSKTAANRWRALGESEKMTRVSSTPDQAIEYSSHLTSECLSEWWDWGEVQKFNLTPAEKLTACTYVSGMRKQVEGWGREHVEDQVGDKEVSGGTESPQE